MIESLWQYVGQVVVLGGGSVAVGFALFKFLGEKWLDGKFAERLQTLKAAQDEQLRHVQSFIDREIHRARTLYDREFETLSEAWKLFCASYNNGLATGTDMYPQLLRYSKAELSDFLDTTAMRSFEKEEMLSINAECWTEHFRRWSNLKRLQGYKNVRRTFADFLSANAIFWSPGIKEKFVGLDGLIGVSIAEMQQRLELPKYLSFDAATKLHRDGPVLKSELEDVIQQRLWSSDSGKVGVLES